jgi:two-component system response regulator QseB
MILVIDDNPTWAASMKRVLERVGFGVTIAETGEQGLEALRAAPTSYELVMIDFGLPDRNGVDITIEARREGFEHPFMLVSGDMGQAQQIGPDAIREARFAGWIGKPFLITELTDALSKAIGHEVPVPTPPAPPVE